MSDADHRALGLALATLEALLIAKGVLKAGQLSERLALMAEVTSETDADAGDALDDWAEMMAQVDAAGVVKQ